MVGNYDIKPWPQAYKKPLKYSIRFKDMPGNLRTEKEAIKQVLKEAVKIWELTGLVRFEEALRGRDLGNEILVLG